MNHFFRDCDKDREHTHNVRAMNDCNQGAPESLQKLEINI